MNRNFALIFTLLAALVAPFSAHAERVDGLYEAEVWVNDQKAESRTQALTVALGEVMVKVSGDAQIGDNSLYASALAAPDSYLQQYRYKAAPSESNRQVLWARFDTSEVNRLLRSGGATIWGEVRPQMLVWLALEQGGQRQLMSANDNTPLQQVLLRHAYRRALSVRLPLLDLTDLSKVSVADVWGGFHDKLPEASKRYQAQVILVGRLAKTSSGYKADWSLYNSDQVVRWELSGAEAADLLKSGLDSSALRLANWFGQTSGVGALSDSGPLNDQIRLKIHAIDSLGGYQRVTSYLNALPGVGDLQVEQVDGSVVTYRLTAKSGMTQLQRTIALGSILSLLMAAPGEEPQPGVLLFSYLP